MTCSPFKCLLALCLIGCSPQGLVVEAGGDEAAEDQSRDPAEANGRSQQAGAGGSAPKGTLGGAGGRLGAGAIGGADGPGGASGGLGSAAADGGVPEPDRGGDGTAATDAAGAPGGAESPPLEPSATGRLAIVAVGYAGRRVCSLDQGATWVADQRLGGGGDDHNLLRDTAFGAGRVVAVGWKLFSSSNGMQWVEHPNPHDQWLGAVAWGNGMFLAAGGLGRVARSNDGVTWQAVAAAGNAHIRQLTFSDGFFWVKSDNNTVYKTKDGAAWTTGGTYPVTIDSEADVGVRLAADGVQVSTNGGAWKTPLKTTGLVGASIGVLP